MLFPLTTESSESQQVAEQEDHGLLSKYVGYTQSHFQIHLSSYNGLCKKTMNIPHSFKNLQHKLSTNLSATSLGCSLNLCSWKRKLSVLICQNSPNRNMGSRVGFDYSEWVCKQASCSLWLFLRWQYLEVKGCFFPWLCPEKCLQLKLFDVSAA